MTNDRDPLLQSMFDDARTELSDTSFTDRVLTRSRQRQYRLGAGLTSAALIALTVFLLFAPPLSDLARSLGELITLSLVDLGEGWAAWVLAPLNNLASLLIMSAKLFFIIRKKARAASFAY